MLNQFTVTYSVLVWISAPHQKAESRLAEVEASLLALDSVTHSVAEFFCEDPDLFKMEECCSIFHSFCEKFMRAVQVRPPDAPARLVLLWGGSVIFPISNNPSVLVFPWCNLQKYNIFSL